MRELRDRKESPKAPSRPCSGANARSLSDPVEQATCVFASQLVNSGKVNQAVYHSTRERLGDAGLVELVTLVGYYTLVSFVLNAFEVPLPDGEVGVFGD